MSTKTIMGALCVVLLATASFAAEEGGDAVRGSIDEFVAANGTDEYRVELVADNHLAQDPDAGAAEGEAMATDAAGAEVREEIKAPATPSAWKFDFTIYIWAPDIRGDSIISGFEQAYSSSFSDLTEFLNLGLFGRFEAWYNDEFGGILELQYMDMEAWADVNGPIRNTEAKVEFRLGFVDLLGAWRFGNWEIGGPADKGFPTAKLDLIAGVRFNTLKQKILLQNVNLGDDSTWVDLMVGLRLTYNFSENVAIVLRGKYGGFGISSSADRNWDALAGMTIRLSDLIALDFGYKVGGLDYTKGEGRDEFAIDVFMYGPVLGLTFKF